MQLQQDTLKVVSSIHVLKTWMHHVSRDSHQYHEAVNNMPKIGWASSILPSYHIGS